jgi:putative ubiquitin-RnfH superfamily antitoxin RatB of RatAB toxin-antitoxin module
MGSMITIEVAYALKEIQHLFTEEVEEGTTVIEALKSSKLLEELPDISLEKVGIFGKLVSNDTVLKQGDRIEVYRPLKVDPRERRRQKVEEERKAST